MIGNLAQFEMENSSMKSSNWAIGGFHGNKGEIAHQSLCWVLISWFYDVLMCYVFLLGGSESLEELGSFPWNESGRMRSPCAPSSPGLYIVLLTHLTHLSLGLH